MKKLFLGIVVAASCVAASAQTAIETGKFFDNWSIGVQGGVYEPTVGQNMLKDMRAGVNIELTKDFTPVFGVSANYFAGINANNANPKAKVFWPNGATPKTAFDFSNLGVNGLINLTNLFCGYKGEPRAFEVVARAGAGWGYILGDCYPQTLPYTNALPYDALPYNELYYDEPRLVVYEQYAAYEEVESGSASAYYNKVTANFGLDFNFNLGQSKAVSVSVKPAISFWDVSPGLNVNKSYLSLTAGLTYHFKNSNGLHYFKAYDVAAMQAEIDRLNAELAKKPKEVIKEVPVVKEVIKEVEKPVVVEANKLAPVVIFRQGKSIIDASQRPSVDMIATYMKNHPESKVVINGYASPEGSAELNQRLSEARAKAVYDMLVNTYKINPSRLSHKGLGVTDELFDENDWNRVAVFIEENKK